VVGIYCTGPGCYSLAAAAFAHYPMAGSEYGVGTRSQQRRTQATTSSTSPTLSARAQLESWQLCRCHSRHTPSVNEEGSGPQPAVITRRRHNLVPRDLD
jgi:hypothetical protein